ncbi:competence type IV pilus assembly protein ComGB [Salinicoccus jeotgali]|uniref:Competence type IV pilus assembly protein ComGB n=2 Tax=Salinicoccus jeotgali TaxID=381634 RepID=A0ABP7F019_9STAP
MRMSLGFTRINSNKLGKYDAHFLIKLADLLETGFTMQQSLLFLLEQYDVLKPKDRLQMIEAVREGKSLGKLLKDMGYGNSVIIQIAFSEIHGKVLETLRESARYIEYVRNTRSKLLKALQYPLLLITIFVGLLLTLNFTVIPQFKSLYSAMGTQSQGIVALLIKALDALPIALLVCFITGVVACIAISAIFSIKDVALKSRIFTKIPLVNYFFTGYQTYRFSREFGYFLNNGLEVKEILDLFIHQEINGYLRYMSESIKDGLMNGESLSLVLGEVELLDAKLAVFVSHGEQNSSVGKELIMFSEYTLERLIMYVENITKKIQPVIFAILGVLIICLYLIIILPIFQMMSAIN